MSVKFSPAIGLSVAKAAQNLPQTATGTLFTISGGTVLVTGLLGLVSTALGATATNLSLGTSADAGTSLATASAVASTAQNSLLIVNGGALSVKTANFLSSFPYAINPFIAAANITWTTSANNTGQVKWYLWYIPIDTDAVVS